MWLSTSAISRLLALVMAWKSPVKWVLISSMGRTCEKPPPVAPPLMPKMGPSEGSLSAIIVRWPASASASPSPTVTVDLPSPAGVGDMALTSTTLPGAVSAAGSRVTSILALWRP